jgi:thymidylate kinase
MNIILEGCDCVGKTSIATALMKLDPRLQLTKCNAPKDMQSGREEYERIVERLNSEDFLLFDRALLGECVYAPLFRGYYPEYMRELETRVSDNTCIFLITAEPIVAQHRFDGEFISVNQIPEIIDEFRSELHSSNYQNKYVIDTTNKTPMQAAIDIVAYVEEANNRCKSWQR